MRKSTGEDQVARSSDTRRGQRADRHRRFHLHLLGGLGALASLGICVGTVFATNAAGVPRAAVDAMPSASAGAGPTTTSAVPASSTVPATSTTFATKGTTPIPTTEPVRSPTTSTTYPKIIVTTTSTTVARTVRNPTPTSTTPASRSLEVCSAVTREVTIRRVERHDGRKVVVVIHRRVELKRRETIRHSKVVGGKHVIVVTHRLVPEVRCRKVFSK
jgi:cytoskeletal protein RodZ